MFRTEGSEEPAIELAGTTFSLETDSEEPGGFAHCEEVRVLGLVVGRDLKARVNIEDGFRIEFEIVEGTVLDSPFDGKGWIRPTFGGRPFQFSFKSENGQLVELSKELQKRAPQLGLGPLPALDSGELSFEATGRGLLSIPDTITITAKAATRDLVVGDLASSLPQAHAAGANAEALRELPVRVAEGAATLTRGIVQIPHLRVKTDHGILRAALAMRKDRSLAGRIRLYATDEVGSFFIKIRQNEETPVLFAPFRESSWAVHEFQLGGTVSEPLVDFWKPGSPLSITATIEQIEKASAPPAPGILPAPPPSLSTSPGKPPVTVPIPELPTPIPAPPALETP